MTTPLAATDPLLAALLSGIAARAESLDERCARGAARPPESESGEPDEARLATWLRAFSPGDPAALRRRLAWEGWSTAGAARALSAAGERPGEEPLPDWLEDAAARLGLGASDPAGDSPAAPDLSDLPFGPLWDPWVAAALARLADDPGAARLPVASLRALARGLGEEIARLAAPAALDSYRAARAIDPAPGSYERFVAAQRRSGQLAFCAEFPVAARQIVRLISTWLAALGELLDRLEQDRPALATRFGANRDPGPLVGLARTDSDRHAGGRGVFRVEFASGLALAYKPRSLAVEAGWEAFLGDLATLGFDDLPPAAPVLARPGYGWMAWGEPAELPDAAAAARWFRRAGALVALAELLGGEDLHAENLIAAADGPLVIDAEMLLQPDRSGSARRDRFAAGLLRRRGEAGRVAAWAGLEPVGDRVISERGRGWQGVGTDDIAPAPAALHARPLANAPRLAGRQLAPREFAADLVAGHRQTWERILAQRAAFVAADGPLARFAGAPVRLLLRPSQDYAQVLDLLAQPRHQRDGVAAGLLLEALARPFATSPQRPRGWDLVVAERRALAGLDVPRFEVAADGLTVTDGAAVASGLLEGSALAAARRRLDELDVAEVARRSAALAAALAPPPAARIDLAAPTGATPLDRALALADRVAGFDAALAAAERPAPPLADRLLDLALYDGRAGRALVLAAADRRDGGRRFAALRPGLLADLEAFLAAEAAAPTARLPLGGLTGLGSLVWSLVALARATGDPALLEPARRLAARITDERIAADRRLDVEGGAAGALLALLALAGATGEPVWRARARRAGEHLRAAATTQAEGGAAWVGERGTALAGMAHGAAGIVRALAALDAATGEAGSAAAIASGLTFERAIFDSQRGNWPVRGGDAVTGARTTWMTAWCHGAPGIALARLALAASDPEQAGAALEAELASAAAATLAAGEGSHDHLCCGAAGRWEALRRLAARRRDAAAAATAADGAAGLLARPLRLPTSPREPEAAAAGLFRGVGGVAWLRLAAGDPELLDPLTLELPGEAAGRSGDRTEEVVVSEAGVTFETLAPGAPTDALAAMTFPIYRPLLALAPTSRHPEQGDPRRIQPLAVVARAGGELLGLALGELPLGGGPPPELLSLFVRPEVRHHGIGAALVGAFEEELARRGFGEVAAVYTTGKPAIVAVERIFAARGWEAPRPRTLSVRFPPARALESELFAERRMRALGAGLELFPWVSAGQNERTEIRASHERQPWITPALAPWRFEGADFDPVSSIGARYRGAIVGWVLNHRVDERTVRFTCSFMRKDISRRGRIVPLYHESLRRLAAAGVPRATFITPVVYPNMIRFIERWIAPIAEFRGETRGARKRLAPLADGATRP